MVAATAIRNTAAGAAKQQKPHSEAEHVGGLKLIGDMRIAQPSHRQVCYGRRRTLRVSGPTIA
jgi:hypothetical protein